MMSGQTALIAVVDEVAPLVDTWRRRYDSSTAADVPAHVTVVFPFLDVDRIGPPVIGELETVFHAHRPFSVRFERCQRFPDALYLEPAPDEPFRALTEAVTTRWPEAPPYGGVFADVIPHLTIATGQQPSVYDEVEAALRPQLPVNAQISSVSLFFGDGKRWREHVRFPLVG
jgi:2'-5' RNA ligase